MFEKNQLLIHRLHGHVIALRPWGDRETICLLTSNGQRRVLWNSFIEPFYTTGSEGRGMVIVEDELTAQIESEGGLRELVGKAAFQKL